MAFIGMAAAQHGFVRGARVEPNIERIGVLDVIFCFIADQFFNSDVLPRFDTLFFDQLCNGFGQLRGSWVQFTGFAMHKECHGYTPLALARQGPVWAIGDHGVQARLAPSREKLGGFNTSQGLFAQACAAIVGFHIHAREPL